MSIQAVSWALQQQRVKLPAARHVLQSLANYADARGSNAFPSIGTLMRDTGFDRRTVQRHLRSLEMAGAIRAGNQLIAAAHCARADRRPTVYDLVMS